MSLKVWLPLVEDLNEKINNMTVVAAAGLSLPMSGANGKLGPGYTFSNSGIKIENLHATSQMSFAMWTKFSESNPNEYHLLDFRLNDNTGYQPICYYKAEESIQIHSAKNGKNDKIKASLKGGAWHHIVVTMEENEGKLYFDGQFKGVVNGIEMHDNTTTNLNIGCRHNGKNPYPGIIQDVRIYDHILSMAEIQELKKGLMIHYTFDDILAEPTTNLVEKGVLKWSKLTVNVSYSYSNGVYTITTATANNGATSGQIRANFPLDILTAGQTYYFSCKYKVISGPGAFSLSDWCDSSLLDKKIKDCGDFYELSAKCSTNRTYNSTYRFLDCNLSANSVIKIWDVQLQTNDKATPYVLGTRESMIRNEAETIQPSTISNITLSTDSACGIYSLSCTGNTMINTPITRDISQGATLSLWINLPKDNSGNNIFPLDSEVVVADNNSQLAFGFFNGVHGIITCAGFNKPLMAHLKTALVNDWNHIAIIRDSDNNVKGYLNGTEYPLESSQNWAHSEPYFSIGCRYSGSWTTYYNGQVDDIRLYSTCLSPKEIKELYDCGGRISNLGDALTGSFIEGTTATKVNKNHTIEINEIIENDDGKASIKKGNILSSRQIIEI